MLMNEKNEKTVQITCEISGGLQKKIKKIRQKKGKRMGWLVRQAVQKYVDGEIVI
jgi:hypothetical protein